MRRDTSKRYPPVTQEPRFLDPTLPMVLPRQKRTPTSGGKLVGVLVCGGRICDPTLLFQARSGSRVKIGFLKCHRTRFLWVSAIMLSGILQRSHAVAFLGFLRWRLNFGQAEQAM